MEDLRQNEKYSFYMRNLGWDVELAEGSYCYIRKIPLIGLKIVKLQRPGRVVTAEFLKELTQRNHALVVYIEPKDNEQLSYYKRHGFKIIKSPLLPTKTILIDVTKTPEVLLAEMHYKTRYNIKLAKRFSVSIKKTKKIRKFASFWQKNALKRGMFLSMKREIEAIYDSFDNKATILSAFHNKKKVGAVLLIDTDEVSYYMYATANAKGKQVFAPTLLVWEALLLAKKRGRKLFDFEGIYDERFPIDSWKGFTRFKRNFGGKEVEYPGILRKFYVPFLFK